MSSFVSLMGSIPMIIYNEIYLMGIMYRHYKWSYFINSVTTAADFIWWMLLIDGGTLIPEKIAPAAIGYLVWVYANYTMYDANSFIIEAGQTGVLEQIYLTPYPLSAKIISRFVACALYCTLELMMAVAALLIFCPISIPFSVDACIAFLITLVGIAGFALLLAGMGLIFKKSQPFAYLLNTLLLFLNGSILNLDKMPGWVQIASKTLPTTQGISVIRSITFNGQTLASTFANGTLLLLMLNSALYLLIGFFVFIMCEKLAQKNATLGHY